MSRTVLSFVFGCLVASVLLPNLRSQDLSLVVLEGRVVDMRGEPLRMVEVKVRSSWVRDSINGPVLARGTTDGDGFYRIPRVPRRRGWVLQAVRDGYCAWPTFHTHWNEPCRIVAHDAVTVRGILLNLAGEPVANAVVLACLPMSSQLPSRSQATTDADGRFVLRNVGVGLQEFKAVVPGEGLVVLDKHVGADCEVVLKPDGRATTTVEVVVRGMPAEHATKVRARLSMPLRMTGTSVLPPPWDYLALGEDGRAKIEFAADISYTVSFWAPGYEVTPARLDATIGEGPHILEATARRLPDAPTTCSFVVRDASGSAMPNVTFVMTSDTSRVMVEGTSDREGRMTITSAAILDEDAELSVVTPGWIASQHLAADSTHFYTRIRHGFKVNPEATEQVQIAKASRVSGRVVLSDEQPATFAGLRLVDVQAGDEGAPPQTRGQSVVGSDGSFVLTRVHAQTPVRILVEGIHGSMSSKAFRLAEPGVNLRLPDLQLPTTSVIEGVVRDADGKLVAGAFVRSSRPGAYAPVLTDRQGRFRISGLPAGPATLSCYLKVRSYSAPQTDVPEVRVGESHTVDLVLIKK